MTSRLTVMEKLTQSEERKGKLKFCFKFKKDKIKILVKYQQDIF